MKKNELLKLIKKQENLKLEFKSKIDDGIGKTICAFANTNNGIILIGINDHGEIIGIHKKHEREIANIAHSCKPSIYPYIKNIEIEDKNVFIVNVKKTNSLHSFKNIAYKRIASHNKPLSPEEVMEHGKNTRRIKWDSLVYKGAGWKDIDVEFVKREFIPLYERVSKKKVTGKPVELLKTLGCIKNNKPTNAGILLFGKNPQKLFMNAYIALARYKGREVYVEKLDYKEFTGNLFQQIDKCNDYLVEHTALMSRLIPGKVRRTDIPEYGRFSIRELITNAVCHRDYEEQGTKIIIKMFDDKIEFYNIGGLPKDITPKNITRKQFSRNQTIAKILAKVEYIEELGEGWNKIIKEHNEHPLKPQLPKIEAEKSSVLITLFSTKEKFKEEKEEIMLNERQKKALEYVKKHGKITNREFKNLFPNVTRETLRKDLKNMINKKIFAKKGAKRGVYYELI